MDFLENLFLIEINVLFLKWAKTNILFALCALKNIVFCRKKNNVASTCHKTNSPALRKKNILSPKKKHSPQPL